jgi:outer membrane protein TolC
VIDIIFHFSYNVGSGGSLNSNHDCNGRSSFQLEGDMTLKKCGIILLFLFLLIFSFSPGFSQTKKSVTIGIMIDGHFEGENEILQIFKKEIFDLMGNEYALDFSQENIIMGDWTAQSVKTGLNKLLKDPKIDIVIAMGILVVNEIYYHTSLEKPVIIPFVIDAELQRLPRKGKNSGVRNLNYLVSISSIMECLSYFKKIAEFDHLVMLGPECVRRDYPEMLKHGRKFLESAEIDVETIWIKDSVDEVIAKLNPDMQAIYITPISHIPRAEFKKLITAINRLKIPSFSHLGGTEVEDGVLATIHKTSDFLRLARRVALNIQRILMGEGAGTLEVDFKSASRLTINMETARKIGVYPTWDVMTEAELVNEEVTAAGKRMTLMDAVNRAIQSNLEVLSKQTEYRAGKQDVRLAATQLLPQVNLSALAVKIDDDRAAAGFGMAAEKTLSGTATFRQAIFSEPLLANLSIQKNLQKSRLADLDRLTMDIALEAAVAYINVLRGRALVRVQKNNLKKTRSNLELARVRENLGVSGASEVYRWEAQYAVSQKQLLDAQNNKDIAEIHLNRLLHYPQSERFVITDTGLDSPFLSTRDKRFFSFINNPWIAGLFLEFWVEYGLKNAPELRSIDKVIAVQKRQLKSATRKYYMPSIWLQAEITNYFSRSGAGTGAMDLSALTPVFNSGQLNALGSLFPPKPGNVDMTFGLQFSLPLFSGGAEMAQRKKEEVELQKLETDRQVAAELVEERIRTTAGFAWTANAKIPLSTKAAQATAKTLELVTDAYSRGAVSILDLIDAQDAALAADRAAANAIYDFLVAMFNAQRAINRLDFVTQTESQILMLNKFEEFLKKKGITLKKKK